MLLASTHYHATANWRAVVVMGVVIVACMMLVRRVVVRVVRGAGSSLIGSAPTGSAYSSSSSIATGTVDAGFYA